MSKPPARAWPSRSSGAKAWTSTTCSRPGSASPCWPGWTASLRAHRPPPPWRGLPGGALGDVRELVAEPRRLAAERDPAARAQDAVELREGLVEVREVVEDGVAEDEVERAVLERQRLGVAGARVDLEPEARGVALQHVDHPRRDVGARRAADLAGEQEVQREVAGARPDLERVAERPGAAGEDLPELAHDLLEPAGAEVDAPLGVVARGRVVVVARVDVADRLRCGRGRHGGGGV